MASLERERLLPKDPDRTLYETQHLETGQTTKDNIKVESKVWIWTSNSYAWSLATLALLFIVFTGLEYALIKLNIPAVNPKDRDDIKFPRCLEDLRRLNEILSVYMDEHFAKIYILFIITYIYLQSFSIPGSMWLSILGGTLFNFWLTLLTVSMCSAIGSSISYIISGSLGSLAIIKLFGKRIERWSEQLKYHREHMLNYMVVLRISPLPPNWLVNLGSPHLCVPLSAFFLGTLIGVAPLSFIHVQAGAALDRLSSTDRLELLTPLNILCLIAVALVALVPVFLKRKLAVE
ncbi:snare associated Golgi protein-domain-containing protein [Sporodiniella umbellata]|nr:snare associated Golgi protein-domain-containing protein [Sporodiniella umbellata]